MFSRILGFLIFALITLFSSDHCIDAAKSDFVLKSFNVSSADSGSIKVEGKISQGKDFAFCTWMKQLEEYDIGIFRAMNLDSDEPTLQVRFYKKDLHGYPRLRLMEQSIQSVSDCNLQNLTSWFHICVTTNKSALNFYLNGFPLKNYTGRANVSLTKNKMTLSLGYVYGNVPKNETNSILYQSNVFDRAITSQEAKDMYNCKFIEGDVLKWTDITSKSPNVKFGTNIKLEKEEVPCPDRPPYNPINCSTGKPLFKRKEKAYSSTSLPKVNTGSSREPESTTVSKIQRKSSVRVDRGSRSENMYQGPTSASLNPVSNSENRNEGPSSRSLYSVSNSGNAGQRPCSRNMYPGSTSGNKDQGSPLRRVYPGANSGNMKKASRTANTYPKSTLGNNYLTYIRSELRKRTTFLEKLDYIINNSFF